MPPAFLLTTLQCAIALSGVLVFVLALLSWQAAWEERQALKAAGLNGCLAAAAKLHLITSSTRLAAALVSCVGGVALMLLPDFNRPAGVIAGVCWLAYSWLLAVNLSVEWWARRTMAAHHKEGV